MKKGFTLAEILIVVGLIGIIAAMTLPTLFHNITEKVLVTKIKKSYAEFIQTVNMMKADNGATDNAQLFGSDETNLEKLKNFAKYNNGAIVCTSASNSCGKVYYTLPAHKNRYDGKGNIARSEIGYPRIITKTGGIILIDYYNTGCTPVTRGAMVTDDKGIKTGDTTWTDERCATATVDVDGEKGRNQFGADLYQIWIYPDHFFIRDNEGGDNFYKSVFQYGKLRYEKY